VTHSTAAIRLAIADDHLIVREGLRLILESADDIAIVGEAADGAALLQVVRETQPSVVLLDLRMPGMDGLETMAHLRREAPAVAVVILTTYNEDELMLRALQAGARGFLLKDTTREALLATIRAAAAGETLLKPEIVARAMTHATAARATAGPAPILTEREREVLAAVARGDRSKEIARRLGITERTVKAHLASVFEKLGVDSRASAVAVAFQRGLLRP
jgi:NarL family two-component system response regulator YdfI